MRPTTRLRQLLAAPEPLFVPGAYDGISARAIEHLGFPAVYVTGYGMEASLLGAPDIGLVSAAEVIGHAGRIARCLSVPVISDADTGYGGIVNVYRTVQEFERSGIAGIHLEDQTLPKRCGGLPGRSVIPMTEMVAKVKAAVAARRDPDFLIIARTDARSVHGVAEAVRRLNAYLAAGADMALIAERYTVAEVAEVSKGITGHLAMCGGIPGWDETLLPFDEFKRLGLKLVLYPVTGLYAAVGAVMETYRNMWAKGGVLPDQASTLIQFDTFNQLTGLPQWESIEAQARA